MEPLARGAVYRHTNLIAKDWRHLARFYQRVFGCTPVSPERDLAGSWLDDATCVPNAHIRGMHMRLPGVTPGGPTLELFSYDDVVPQSKPTPDRAGFGHVAFSVDDVESSVAAVIAEGGSRFGATVVLDVHGAGKLCFAYVRDPEGNIIELQRWV